MRRPLLLLLFFLCLAILVCYYTGVPMRSSCLEVLEDRVVQTRGIIISVQIKDGYYSLTALCEPDTGRREKLLIRLKAEDADEYVFSLPGREFFATGKISLPSGSRNPGCFNYALYLKARGISVIQDVSRFKFSAGAVKNSLLNFLSVSKGNFIVSLKSTLDEKSFSLLSGILFGEKGYMSDSLYEEFQQNGIAHILAVSGLHVGLLYAFVKKLSENGNTPLTALITVFLLMCYIVLAGFSYSVIRASSMICLNILSFFLKRRCDMVCAASVTALAMLVYNPYILFDSGAQLSFCCAYCIGVIYPWLENRVKALSSRYKKEWPLRLTKSFGLGLVIQAGMLPLMLYHFMHFSFLSFFINPPAVALASLILPFGLFAYLVSLGSFMLKSFIKEKLIITAASSVAVFFTKLLSLLSTLASIISEGKDCIALPFGITALFYVCLFWYFSETRYVLLRKKKEKACLAVWGTLIGLSVLLPFGFGITNTPFPWKYNEYKAVFLDVGQGDCTHFGGSCNVLIDGGGSYYSNIAEKTLKPYLLKNGISSIDLAVVTHLDSDHSRGIAQLSEIMDIKTIAFPCVCREEDLTAFKSGEKIFLSSGDSIKAGDWSFTVISPSKSDISEEYDSNASSLVLIAEKEETKILMTADIDKETEEKLCKKEGSRLKADILKIAHHGSAGSSGEIFINTVNPETAVISVGEGNSYGHPDTGVLELLLKSGIIIRRTDMEGAICIPENKREFTLTDYSIKH